MTKTLEIDIDIGKKEKIKDLESNNVNKQMYNIT